MKRLLLFVLVATSLAACKKTEVPKATPNIVGIWELHRRYGGNILPQDTTYQAGNGNILQFNSDSTYKSYTNGTLTRSGTFHIITRSGYQMTQLPNVELFFDNDTTIYYFISLSGNSLTLQPQLGDVSTQQYEKLVSSYNL